MKSVALGRSTLRTPTRTTITARGGLILVLLGYVLLAALWSFVVPLGEGPDEPAHLAYARWLAHERRLPVQGDDAASSDVPGEGHQPPLAYLLMTPFVAWLQADAALPLQGNPAFRWGGGTQPNAYLHGVAEQPPYRGVVLAWHLARLWSVALGAASVALVAATARRLWPTSAWLPLGAAAIVAFNPQWVFQHALVSNDPLTITLGSLLIFQAVAWTQRPDDATPRQAWRWAVVVGITLGALLITKQSALALVPIPFVAALLRPRSRETWLWQSIIIMAICLVLAGWWYARNTLLYGDALGLQVFQQTFATGDFSPRSWQSWRNGGWNLLRSSFGAFGWLTLPLPNGAFAIMQVMILVAGAGLLASVGTPTWRGRGRGVLLLVLAVALVGAWTVLFALTAGAVAWQGRFLFPAAPALSILLCVGLAHALPRRAALVALPVVCGLLAVSLPFTLIRPAYTTPAVAANDLPRGTMYARFDWGWRRAFELQDVSFAPTVQSGDTLRIGLTWHMVEPVEQKWFVFVHIVDDAETIVAKRDAEPLEGAHSTNTWVPGDWYRDTQLVDMTGVAPGTYRVRIGLWNPDTGERLGMYNEQGRLSGDLWEAGAVEVVAPTTTHEYRHLLIG